MSGRKLFAQRCWQDFKFQGRVFRSVIDWTIFLYLFVPGVAFLIIINRSWWLDTPQWIQEVPLEALFIVFYLLSLIGGYRTFLLEADQLFILQKEKLISGLKTCAIAYSIFLQWVGMLFIFVLSLPFLIRFYQLNVSEVAQLFLFFCLCKSLILLINKLVGAKATHWVKIILMGLIFVLFASLTVAISSMFIAGNPFPLWIISAVIFVTLYWSFQSWITTHSDALADMENDRKERLKYVRFILINSNVVPRQLNFTRKRPWLFRNSGRIFQNRTTENGLVEMFIKVFFRSGTYIPNYLQITGVTISGLVVLPPIWLKCLLYLMFMLFARVWMETVWKTITSKPLLTTLLSDEDKMLNAKKRVLWLFLTPGYVFVIIIATLATWIYSMI